MIGNCDMQVPLAFNGDDRGNGSFAEPIVSTSLLSI